MNYLRSALITLLILAAPVFAKDPVLSDFAHGVRLDPKDSNNAFFEFSLPIDVYRGATRNDLGDICVFNAQGEVVPFALYQPAGELSTPETKQLPMFPLYGDKELDPTDLSLLVKKDKAGTIIHVKSGRARDSARDITSYLVDATSLEHPISSLELDWEGLPESYVGKITVQYSDDLEHWTRLVSGAVVADLRYGGQGLKRRAIELGSVKAKYYMLSSPAARMLPLKSISAKKTRRNIDQPRNWLTVFVDQQSDRPEEYHFQLMGHMPVDRLRVIPPQKNTFFKMAVFSRPLGAKTAWIQRSAGTAYRVEFQGEEIMSPDISLSPVSDDFWLVRTDKSGGGLGKGLPKIEVGWLPHKVLFVARGDAPFTLAYGSKAVTSYNASKNSELLKFKEDQKDKAVIKTIEPGAQMVLGGSARISGGAPVNWKQWLLCGLLVLGVIVMAWMAVRLYRQMEAGSE